MATTEQIPCLARGEDGESCYGEIIYDPGEPEVGARGKVYCGKCGALYDISPHGTEQSKDSLPTEKEVRGEAVVSDTVDTFEAARANAAEAFANHKAGCADCGGPDKWASKRTMCAEGLRLLNDYDVAAKACIDNE